MADMKGKVKWMATKLNEQKRKIIWLSVGLGLALAMDTVPKSVSER